MTDTIYSWKELEFQEFEDWERTQKNCSNYRYDRNTLVIDWVIATNRNAGKSFFGVSLGNTPYQNCHVHSAAEEFLSELTQYQNQKQVGWLLGKMNSLHFATDRQKGSNDGYWLQPKASQSEGYLHGYDEGISLKMAQGYTVRGLDTDRPYLYP